MTAISQREVRAGLEPNLARLWRYGLMLAGARDVAEDLVQATCVRALERADQFQSGTRVDRWLFSILRSIWLNELRSRRVREGAGFVDASLALVFDGGGTTEANILAAQVLREVGGLPEAQREAVLLVYVEGFSYREAAEMLGTPIGTVMSRLAAARLALGKLQGTAASDATLTAAKSTGTGSSMSGDDDDARWSPLSTRNSTKARAARSPRVWPPTPIARAPGAAADGGRAFAPAFQSCA